MSRRNLSVIIVPHDRGHSWTIKTSYLRLRLFGVVAVLCVIAIGAVMVHYVVLLRKTREMTRLEAENRALTEEVSVVEELNKKMESYEVYVERINMLLGVGEDPGLVPANGIAAEELPDQADGGIEVVPAQEDRTIRVHSMTGEIPTEWPLTQRGFITRGFLESYTAHPGVDIAVPENTAVRATASGLVYMAGWDNVYGNYVEIKHSDGYSTVYGHNSNLIVQEGQWVRRGDIIAFSGNTGRSTAPHLHYEVRCKGVAVDPQPFLLGYGKGNRIEG